MFNIHLIRKIVPFIGLFFILLLLASRQPAAAVGETSTRFGIFVPPNGENTGRHATLIVTAVQDNTLIDIIDDDADGDDDDTVTGLLLHTGQSYILYIREGAVNDDLGGKADGDYFQITANKPILVANLTTNTDWQHDFLPADNRRMSGTSFYLYRPRGFSQAHGRNQLLNIFAYNDNTHVQIFDITVTPKTTSGVTTVHPPGQGTLIYSATLQTGEDFLERHGHRVPLPEGRTFHIVSNKDVTVQFGSLSKGASGSRDGGSYVPGKTGASADKIFYFGIPYEYPSERELRLVSYDKPANVTVRGWNPNTNAWVTVATVSLPKFGHHALIGQALGPNYYLFEVTANETISVFEANWLETGNFGTSDIMTFISAQDGSGAGQFFLAYMGPPALQLGVQLSHLYVYAYQPVSGIAYDPDSYGEYIELYNNSSQTLNLSGWYLRNSDGWVLTLPAGAAVAPGATYLLEFHQRASNAPANFVYGDLFPKFKLGNGADTITLHNAAGAVVDMVDYDDSWGKHGVYYALERINPDLPFTAANARDSAAFVATSGSNLGAYYGTPGQRQNGGNGQGGLVINELMTGRFYDAFTIPANGYYAVSLTVDEWRGLNNGSNPNTQNGPESAYLVVETDAPVSVMNANWNDNWLAYGTGTLQPDPTVNHMADYYQRQAGEQVIFTTYAGNEFNTLFNPITRITIPPGILYTPGSYQTPPQLAGVVPSETQNSNGSWTLTWAHNQPLASGDMVRFQVWGVIDPATPESRLLQSVALVEGVDVIGSQYASQDSAVIAVGPPGGDEPTMLGDVVINEVLPDPLCGSEWIELHNRSTNSINIGGWELSDGDGFIYRFPELTFIPNNGYLVVYLGDGMNSGSAHFTGADYAGALEGREDQVALYTGSFHDAATLVDFVQWATGSLQDPADEATAVAAGKWPAGTFVPAPLTGQSLGRDRSATNSFSPADWDNRGGPDSDGVPTPGALNVSIPGVDVTPPGTVRDARVTAVIGQEGTLQLTWRNPADGDLAGVVVLRDTATFPAGLNEGQELFRGLATSFTDSSITPGEAVYYTILAYDDAGNTTCPNPAAQTRAIAPQRIFIVYEDLKGIGWVDWDTNDLVVIQDTAVQLTDAGISQIQANFSLEARGSSYDHAFNFTVELRGEATATVQRYNAAGDLIATETSSSRDFVDLTIFPNSRASLPPTHPGGTANAVSGTPLVEGPFVEVTITLADPAANPPETAQLPPFDPWLRVHNTGQSIHLMEAGYVSDSQRVWDANSPLKGRDIPLGLSFNQAWAWPEENRPIWLAYPQYAAYITSGQTSHLNWYTAPDPAHLWTPGGGRNGQWSIVNDQWSTAEAHSALRTPHSAIGWPQATGGLVFASPLIVDVNGDGANELVVAGQDGYVYIWQADGTPLPGWPKYTFAPVRSSPAVGDIDGDGDLEIVVGADNGRLYAWHHTGAIVNGFPVTLAQIEDWRLETNPQSLIATLQSPSIKATPALADLNGDGALEIVAHTTAAKLFVVDGAGAIWPGWPQQMGGVPELYGNFITGSTPAVGDMDGDDVPEIVVGSTDGRVYAYRLDGSLLSTFWPRQTRDWVYASPVLVDLNQDGYRDVVTTSGDGRLYAWRGDGVALPGFPVRVRGGIISSPAVADLDGNGRLAVIFATLRGQVWAVDEHGVPLPGWPRDVGAPIYSSPIVGDIDGDGDQEVIVGAHDGALHGWHHNGIPIVDWPLSTGDWIVSTPALGDLDGDGKVEVAVGSYDQGVYVWDLAGAYDAANMAWPAFHGGVRRDGVVETAVPLLPLPETQTFYLPIIAKP